MDAVRVDRWLCAARIFKSRTAAQDACVGGHVRLNQHAVRASHLLRVGDRVEASAPRGRVVLIVVALADKRLSPPAARLLYEDHSPPPPPRGRRFAFRVEAPGARPRPTGGSLGGCEVGELGWGGELGWSPRGLYSTSSSGTSRGGALAFCPSSSRGRAGCAESSAGCSGASLAAAASGGSVFASAGAARPRRFGPK